MKWDGRIALSVALALASCDRARHDEQGTDETRRVDDQGRVVLSSDERAALGLQTEVARGGSLTERALRFGRVVARPEENVIVVAPVTARLLEPKLALGAQVSSGDALVVLEPLVDTASRATLEAQRRELQGQVEAARAQVTAKQTELNRVSALVSSGLATDSERAQAQAALASEQARAESFRRASGQLARVTGGHIELRAPVDGVLATLVTEKGSLIEQGTTLARIVRAGPRWIDIAVPPSDPVGTGYRVEGGSEVAATLLARGLLVQPDGTRRDRLQAPAEAAADLLPGATLPVDVLHERHGVLVPARAVVRRGHESIVFVEVREGHYEPRPVRIAARDDAQALVGSGISARDRVVSEGASALLGELGTGGPE